jgi:hypothetical protein
MRLYNDSGIPTLKQRTCQEGLLDATGVLGDDTDRK